MVPPEETVLGWGGQFAGQSGTIVRLANMRVCLVTRTRSRVVLTSTGFTVSPMPTRSSRQLAILSGLVALIAVVIGIVFFATSHSLRGTAPLIIAALAAGYGLVSARRRSSVRS